MRKFSEQYARKSGTYFCVDKGVTSVVIKVYLDWICLTFVTINIEFMIFFNHICETLCWFLHFFLIHSRVLGAGGHAECGNWVGIISFLNL